MAKSEKIKTQLFIDKELHKNLYISAIIYEITPSAMLEKILKCYFKKDLADPEKANL